MTRPSGPVRAPAMAGWMLVTATCLLCGCDDPEPRLRTAAASGPTATVRPPATVGTGAVAAARFVRLEALSEVNGNDWAAVADFNVLDAGGAVLDRNGWTATADSEEVVGEDGAASHAIDSDPRSFWHTRWDGGRPPHLLVIDMGAVHSVGGFRYLPRPVRANGRIAGWRFSTSPNGVAWTLAASGTFPEGEAEVTVRLATPESVSAAAAAAQAAAAAARAPQPAGNPARVARIAAYGAGPLVPAPTWRPAEAVGVDTVRRLEDGRHLFYSAAGTTGERPPGPALVDGRPVGDGSATAYLTGRTLAAPRPGAPTLAAAPSASAAGLTETGFAAGDFTAPRFTAVHGCRSISTGTSFVGHYCFANGPASGSGNATAIASGPYGAKLPAVYSYHANSWEEEFVVTDRAFGLVFANSASPIDVEIDGTPVEAGPTISSGAEGWTLTFDFHGTVARRTVRVISGVGSVAPTLRGVALSAGGRVDAGPPPRDQLLLFGDSINAAVTPTSEAGAQMLSYWLQRELGFDGAINLAVGGSGYVSENPGSFNVPHLLANPVNRQLIADYAPSVRHVLVSAGFNDRNIALAEVQAAALASWRALRALLPDTRITVTDGWSGSSGPDARALALADALAKAFATWGDGNARLVRSVGTSASTAYVQGSGTAGTPPSDGNSSRYTSVDGVHPSPAGARYLARRLAEDLSAAWKGAY